MNYELRIMKRTKGIKKTSLFPGQTLITLLFFMVIAMTIISTAVMLLILNSRGTSQLAEGMRAYAVAEGGAENAVLRLLRDDTYTGETLPVGDGTATITVTGSSPKTITSTGQVGAYMKRIEVVVGYTNNVLTISTWREIN
jgi:hypothetical protein